MAKFCSQCGAACNEGQAFCSRCGAKIQQTTDSTYHYSYAKPEKVSTQQSTYRQPQQSSYQQPQQSAYRQPAGQHPLNQQVVSASGEQLGMNWYKFIIYFMLYAAAVSSVLSIFGYIRVRQQLKEFVGYAAALDDVISSLQTMMIVAIVICAVQAVWAIWVRNKLAKYQADAPKQFLLMLTVNLIVGIGLVFWSNSLYGQLEELGAGNLYSSGQSAVIAGYAITAVMIAVNYTYFKKRQHLFNQ